MATVTTPVLVVAGALDVSAPPLVASELAGMFPNATLAIQPGTGHIPWLDDPAWFTAAITDFLR